MCPISCSLENVDTGLSSGGTAGVVITVLAVIATACAVIIGLLAWRYHPIVFSGEVEDADSENSEEGSTTGTDKDNRSITDMSATTEEDNSGKDNTTITEEYNSSKGATTDSDKDNSTITEEDNSDWSSRKDYVSIKDHRK